MLFAFLDGPGPRAADYLLVCGVVFAPLLLLAVAARSLLGGSPTPAWLLLPALLGGVGIGYLVVLAGWPRRGGGVVTVWWVAAAAAVAVQPVVGFVEAVKRGWVRRRG